MRVCGSDAAIARGDVHDDGGAIRGHDYLPCVWVGNARTHAA